MNDYKELIGDIRTCLIAQPNQTLYKQLLREAANAIVQLVEERDAAVADLAEGKSCYTCKNINNSKVCGECYRIDLLADNRVAKMWEWRGVKGAEHE